MNEGLVVLVRGFIAFFALLIFARLLGKQQISQLTFFDYILGITIGSIASSMTVDLGSRAWPHFVGLLTWFAAVLILQIITMKSRKISKYIDGEPTILIMNGKIMDKAMKKIRFRLSDLLELLREKDAFDITEIEFAILETSGKLSVLKKSQFQPVTPNDMKIQTNYKGLQSDLIYDGKVITDNLKAINLDQKWLMKELKKQNITDPSEVFYAALNTEGKLYVDKFAEKVEVKMPGTYSNIKEKEK